MNFALSREIPHYLNFLGCPVTPCVESRFAIAKKGSSGRLSGEISKSFEQHVQLLVIGAAGVAGVAGTASCWPLATGCRKCRLLALMPAHAAGAAMLALLAAGDGASGAWLMTVAAADC